MTNFAVIFPGQGSQNTEMLDSYANVESFNSVINQASDILSYDIREITKDESKLNDTTFTQPVIVAVSVAMWNTWVDEKVSRPIFSAGHSLGEYSALVASGIISLNDCLLIVKERARMMIDAMKDRKSSMAAVLGLESSKIISICKELTSPESIIEAVNFNSDLQTVIAGDEHAIHKSIDLLKKAGAKLVKPLPVSVASHTTLMKACGEKLNNLLLNTKLNNGDFPVFHNIDASCKNSSSDIIESLCKQVYSPVLWNETIKTMRENKVDIFIEVGPGKVLAGLNKRIDKEIKSYSLSDYNVISEIDLE